MRRASTLSIRLPSSVCPESPVVTSDRLSAALRDGARLRAVDAEGLVDAPPSSLRSGADRALYRAKSDGRDRACLSSSR